MRPTSGASTTRSFDANNGNLLSVTGDGITTSYTYDGQGNPASATFPRYLTHTYSSYKRGIPQSEWQPEGVNLSRSVSDAGNVLLETTANRGPRAMGMTRPNRDHLYRLPCRQCGNNLLRHRVEDCDEGGAGRVHVL